MTTLDPLIFTSTSTTPTSSAPVVALVFGSVVAQEDVWTPPAVGVYRGGSVLASMSWSKAVELPVSMVVPYQEARPLIQQSCLTIKPAEAINVDFSTVWKNDFLRSDYFLKAAWKEAVYSHVDGVVLPWGIKQDIPALGVILAWKSCALKHQAILVVPWSKLVASNHDFVVPYKPSKLLAKVLQAPWSNWAKTTCLLAAIPWQTARALHTFGVGAFAVRGAPPASDLQPIQVPLVFCELYPANGWPSSVAIVFGVSRCNGGASGAEFVILPARVYMTVHNVFAQLLPSMANVPIFDATLSADQGSFAWSFNATGPESLFAQLARNTTLPVQIKLTMDGLEWVFLVETLRRTGAFGKHGVAITGRSVTALAGAPWSREGSYNNGTDMNAQQIAVQALDLSDIDLDWGVADWLVPAGAWSHSGSRLSAVQRVAEAAGGYLQSHRSAATLQVRHPYPLLPGGVLGGPWNWAGVTPDIELADDVVIVSAKEVKDGADVDAVYVSGTNQGVIALVKRGGTAGAKLAAMQADPLITHVDAATQRGLSILGTAGAKEHVTLELPVLTGSGQPGVIDVGKLVQVNEVIPWRGMVRGVSVSYSRPSMRQTITLERHL
jgi:hypothetical protein